MDVKCPNGFLFGHDWCEYIECDQSCPNDVFYKCKDIKCFCVGKADFGNMIIATIKARECTNHRVTYTAYRCKYCGGYHIGRRHV